MTHEELLQELKDISPPAEPEWWLIAPGYMIIILLLLSLIGLLWIALQRRKTRRRFTTARLELERIRRAYLESDDAQQLAGELAQWLKRVSLLAFPESRLESVSGSRWLSFLDGTLDDESFTRGAGQVFADAIYQRQVQLDSDRILSLCERWLVAVKPRLLRRGEG